MIVMKQKTITFAQRLQELLDEKDWSNYRLAKETCLHKQAIGRYLSGENDPTFAVVLKIARALNVSLAVFDNVTLPKPEPKGQSHDRSTS